MNHIPVVDPAAIDRLREWGGDALPKKMIDIFLTHTPERMEQIRTGIGTGDARKAETGAHSMKSSAGNVGAVRLQRLAEEAEGLAEEGRMAELAELLPRVEEAFETACGELRNLMEGMVE